jgi:hypothetical protein
MILFLLFAEKGKKSQGPMTFFVRLVLVNFKVGQKPQKLFKMVV